jgi:hypothetical protein
MDSSGLLTCALWTAGSAISIQGMDEGVMKLETLKDSKGPQVGVTNRERRPERLKYRVIAKTPQFGRKFNGRMTTRFHFKKARTAARATPGVTAVFGEE